MDEELLRDEIYKRLGVEKGSLTSESGNDWQRAKNEILEEWKQKEQQEKQTEIEIDYLTLDKNSVLFQNILHDTSPAKQTYKSALATRDDLSEEEMLLLAKTGGRDILINLSRQQTLPTAVIDLIVSNGVYIAKKTLVEQHTLSPDQKASLLAHFNQHPETYDESLRARLIV